MGKEKRKSREEIIIENAEKTLKQDNNRALFKQLIEPNLNLVCKICMNYTAKPEDVDDNYQENLINLYKYIHTYNPEQTLLTWIYICTKRYTVDLEKKRNKMKVDCVDIDNMPNAFVENIIEDIQPELTMDNWREVLSDEVIEALDELNPDYRDMFLKKSMGYKLKEIMKEFYDNGSLKTKNIETTKSRIFLARNRMKVRLKEYYAKDRD